MQNKLDNIYEETTTGDIAQAYPLNQAPNTYQHNMVFNSINPYSGIIIDQNGQIGPELNKQKPETQHKFFNSNKIDQFSI